MEILGLVVDGAVEAELLHQVAALVRAAGDAHHAAALDPRDLSGNAAHRAGGTGNDHGFPGLWLAHVEQGEVGGHAGHAQGGEVEGQGRLVRVHLLEVARLAEEVILHADHAADVIARLELRVPGGQHLADTEGTHHFAQGHRCDVGAGVVHPAAHGGVQRQVEVFHQHLAGAGFADRGFHVGEGLAAGGADRTLGKEELAVERGHGRSSGLESLGDSPPAGRGQVRCPGRMCRHEYR
ncbi:hypothetical protein D3C80_426320 [compost metagenome]